MYNGKEILKIVDFVDEIKSWNNENMYLIPNISQLMNYSAFGYLLSLIPRIDNSLFSTISDDFLSGLYQINRNFNSYTYSNLISVANSKMPQISSDLEVELNSAKDFLNEDYFNTQLNLNNISLYSFTPPSLIEQWISEAKAVLDSALQTVLDLLNIKSTSSLRWQKYKLTKIINSSQFTSIRNDSQLRFAMSPAMLIVTELTGFFLKLLGAGTLLGNTLNYAAGALVLKQINSGGAISLNYLTAAFLRTLPDIPKIFSPTGMAAGAWSVLMLYAEPILLSAILTTTLIKNKVKLGTNILIYADGDKQFSVLSDKSDFAKINAKLTDKKIAKLTNRSYTNYYGFSVNSKDEVTYAVNLNTNQIVPNPTQLYQQFF